MYTAIGTNTDSLPRQSGLRFGLENALIKKSFAASKKSVQRRKKKIIGRLQKKTGKTQIVCLILMFLTRCYVIFLCQRQRPSKQRKRRVLCYLVVSLIIVVLILEALSDCIIWPLSGCENKVNFQMSVNLRRRIRLPNSDKFASSMNC